MWLRIVVIVVALGLCAAKAETGLAQRQDILDSSLVVRFLDAAYGEAVWITTPNIDPERRATILINCGPPGFGGRLALQLQTAKVTRIDSLILSGAGDELIGGCADLLQQIPIREIRWTGQRGETAAWDALDALFTAQKWELVRMAQPDVLYWGD
ncbi:MAG TPA: hypothetical protein VFG86_10955, partial [Chloroflexota bacterium]|nr:hypothetical protein [Chloroflexota bacterium]